MKTTDNSDPPSSPLGAGALAKSGNRLLAAACEGVLALLATGSRRERFALGAVIQEARQSAAAAYFLDDGVASVVKPDDSGRITELCLVGREGFIGTPLMMADGYCDFRVLAQTDGLSAVRVDAAVFCRALDMNVRFRRQLLDAVHVQSLQIADNLVSAAWQQVRNRLARWLLMYRDRVGSPRFSVTHEFMAIMIGAQRPRITEALHALEEAGAIVTGRGSVAIRDEAYLVRLAGSAYGMPEQAAARLQKRRDEHRQTNVAGQA